jgi:hypothetical protein
MNETIVKLPSIFIYKDAVNEMVKNYQNGKHGLLSEQLGRPETKSGWYSRQQFEEIVQEMDYQNASGIRMYFGAYNAGHPQYANQLTVIFVPTEFDESTEEHKDIIIDHTETFEDRDAFTKTMRTKSDPKNLDTIALCPPTCLGHDSFYPYPE